jgi:chaperonin GroES
MKIRPLHDRVIVKRLEEVRTTASGIYAGQSVKVDGEELLVMREEDLMGVIEG